MFYSQLVWYICTYRAIAVSILYLQYKITLNPWNYFQNDFFLRISIKSIPYLLINLGIHPWVLSWPRKILTWIWISKYIVSFIFWLGGWWWHWHWHSSTNTDMYTLMPTDFTWRICKLFNGESWSEPLLNYVYKSTCWCMSAMTMRDMTFA